ncbi:MAG: 6-phosphogluconolactonase [Myxococcaceae bacterium]
MKGPVMREVRIAEDAAGAARLAAAEVKQVLAAAAHSPRPFALALSGGNAPRLLYRSLAEAPAGVIPWERIHLFWGDERCVPPDDPASNYAMAQETLLSRVPVPPGNVHRVLSELRPPERAAAAYEETLRSFFGEEGQWPSFDLALLGVGADGHTASLFPGHPALDERVRWVSAVHSPTASPSWRITLTLPVLSQSRRVFFLVAGSEKAQVTGEILGDPDRAARPLPAARVQAREQLIWFVSRDAAGR